MLKTLLILFILCINLIHADMSKWYHDWTSSSQATFADFEIDHILTDEEAAFVANHYRIVSIEKCSGGANYTTEEVVYQTAYQLKKIDPTIKVFFIGQQMQLQLNVMMLIKNFHNIQNGG